MFSYENTKISNPYLKINPTNFLRKNIMFCFSKRTHLCPTDSRTPRDDAILNSILKLKFLLASQTFVAWSIRMVRFVPTSGEYNCRKRHIDCTCLNSTRARCRFVFARYKYHEHICLLL